MNEAANNQRKSGSTLSNIKKNRASKIQDQLGKKPPSDIELEKAVLGALMLEKDALTDVVELLKPDTFYKDSHQKIFGAIQDLFSMSEPVDTLTVVSRLKAKGELELVGGSYTIASLTQRVESAANIEYHARLLLEHAIKRELIHISRKIQENAFEETTDAFDILDQMEQALFEISELNIRKNYEKMNSIIQRALKNIEDMRDKKDGLTGVPSGFSDLDRLTSGWQRSDMIICAARPAMGKCLGIDTPVLMFDGSIKKVQDIKVGDLLMGDDSTPRKVLSLARGKEKMYWVRQNRGMDYRVNESHILSLKRSRNEGPHKHGDVLDISVREYLTKSPKFKSNYKGYKVAVEFQEKNLPFSPYFLGLWLGDGKSTDVRVFNEDIEIIDYLNEYADELGGVVSVGTQEGKCNSYAITKIQSDVITEKVPLQTRLRDFDLLNNKHIPEDFLINSTKNRLKLLAGLIDSDGYYDPVSNGYEITQKNEGLAKQIAFLCNSLGFRTSLNSKIARIKKTNYECEVFRVRFYGDTDRIPVKIGRKQCLKWKSKVSWQHTGIHLEEDIVDDYYGFVLDGNHRFLLGDFTVTHNTAFSLSILRNAAVMFKKPVAFFSLEMSSEQLVNRLISSEAQITSEKLKKGTLSDDEWAQIIHKTSSLNEAPIFLDDTPALSLLELRAKARRLKAQNDIEMIIIDYLQLMTGDSGKGGNREQEIAQISRGLKQLAKELNIPVIALSQLSRAVETRGGDKRPQLSDLRESGSIEQDADMVMFLYRPEYYGITEDAEGNSVDGLGEVIFAKHRNGSTGTIPLKFIGQYTKFTDWDDSGIGGLTPIQDILTRQEDELPTSTITMGSKANKISDAPSTPPPLDEEPPF